MRLYNVDSNPVVVGGWQNPAVFPGAYGDFDGETAERLLATGRWSMENPRGGLPQERAFKARRKAEAETKETLDPAVPEKGATQCQS